jgi:hypothetical protein
MATLLAAYAADAVVLVFLEYAGSASPAPRATPRRGDHLALHCNVSSPLGRIHCGAPRCGERI